MHKYLLFFGAYGWEKGYVDSKKTICNDIGAALTYLITHWAEITPPESEETK